MQPPRQPSRSVRRPEAQASASFRDGLQPRSTDVFIAVMGVTGAGKSTFVSKCCDRKIAIGHNLQACTTTVDVYPCEINEATTVYLIDTPGFDDTNRSDTEVLREIATWLTDSYTAKIRLNGIIYLHRISDVRMQGSAKKNLFMFKKLCGPSALKNVILATTMWDRVSEAEGAAREDELTSTPDFWGWMVGQGSRVCRHTGSRTSAFALIQILMQDSTSVTLELQQQMVNENKNLNETDAGKELQAEIAKERKKFEKSLVELKQQLEEAMEEHDKESMQVMKEQQEVYNRRVAQLESSAEELKISMEKLHTDKYAKLEAKLQEEKAQHEQLLRYLEEERKQRESELLREREAATARESEALAELKRLQIQAPRSDPGAKGSGVDNYLYWWGNVLEMKTRAEVSLAIVGDSFYFRGPRSTVGIWQPPGGRIDDLSYHGLRILALGEKNTWMSINESRTRTEWSGVPEVYPDLERTWNDPKTDLGQVNQIVLGVDENYFIHGSKRNRWQLNQEIVDDAKLYENAHKIDVCALGRGGAYFIRLTDGVCYWNLKDHYTSLEATLEKNKTEGSGRNSKIKAAALSLTSDHYIVVYRDGSSAFTEPKGYDVMWKKWVKKNFDF